MIPHLHHVSKLILLLFFCERPLDSGGVFCYVWRVMKLSRLLLISLIVGALGGYLCEPWLRDIFFAEKKKPVVVAPKPKPKPKPVEPKPEEPKPEPVVVTEEPEPEPVEPEEEVVPEEIVKVEPAATGELNEADYQGDLPATAWGAPVSLEKQLSSRIRSGLKNRDIQSIQAFIAKPENRLMLAQWEVLHRADLKELSKVLKGEAARDLAPLLNNLRWVSALAYDGELEKTEVVLAMIHHFRQVDPNMDKDANAEEGARPSMLKARTAAAVAVEFTRNGWYGEDKELTAKEIATMREQGIVLPKRKGKGKADLYRLARERYLYLAESIDGELLNGGYAKLPDWLLHFVCGWKGNSPFGTASTMRWLRDNVSAPARFYEGMAYQVPYRPTNIFGDSIHGAEYYQPFEPLYEGNFSKMTRDVGSVCGGLSHYGTSAACANGVPAFTMGEPGHCAYAVYINNKWVPCNSIGEEHHPHWSVWGESSWSALQMMTAMYQDGARTRDAQYVATIASVYADNRNAEHALDLYEMSAGMQPLYKPVLTYYIDTATDSLRSNARKWIGVNKFICESVAKNHPEMCSKFLMGKIYPAMFAHVRSDKHKMQAFRDFFGYLDTNQGGAWDIEPLLTQQYNSMGKAQARRLEYMKMVIDVGASKTDFSQAIAWAVRASAQEGKRMGEKVFEMATQAAANSSDKELMDAAFIRAGEELGDAALVLKYSEPYLGKQTEMPFFERPAGNLVSPEGYVVVDEPFEDQRIFTQHQAALTETGGFIRSRPGKHQPVTVVLPKVTPLGAVVIVPKGGCSEYRDWKVEISHDGKAWETLMHLPDSSEEKHVRVDVTGGQKARYIRIDSGDKQEIGIQFNAILVYDNTKAK